MAFKIRQNPFSAGALPRTLLHGELTTLPQTHSRLERGQWDTLPIIHPIRHRPKFGARHASPQNSSQIYAYGRKHARAIRKPMPSAASAKIRNAYRTRQTMHTVDTDTVLHFLPSVILTEREQSETAHLHQSKFTFLIWNTFKIRL